MCFLIIFIYFGGIIAVVNDDYDDDNDDGDDLRRGGHFIIGIFNKISNRCAHTHRSFSYFRFIFTYFYFVWYGNDKIYHVRELKCELIFVMSENDNNTNNGVVQIDMPYIIYSQKGHY